MPEQNTPVEVASNEGLGLAPEREGQPRTLTMAMPWERERGHWYSPAAVREMLDDAVAAERERWREAAERAIEALRELERYEYATATIELRHAAEALRVLCRPNVL